MVNPEIARSWNSLDVVGLNEIVEKRCKSRGRAESHQVTGILSKKNAKESGTCWNEIHDHSSYDLLNAAKSCHALWLSKSCLQDLKRLSNAVLSKQCEILEICSDAK